MGKEKNKIKFKKIVISKLDHSSQSILIGGAIEGNDSSLVCRTDKSNCCVSNPPCIKWPSNHSERLC